VLRKDFKIWELRYGCNGLAERARSGGCGMSFGPGYPTNIVGGARGSPCQSGHRRPGVMSIVSPPLT
jgi:hypothetical protein